MNFNRLSKAVSVILTIYGCLCPNAWAMDHQLLKDVQVQPVEINLNESRQVQISWQQSVVGKVKAMICDLDGNIVRPLVDNETLQAGTHSATWDGKDLNGHTCPVGAYLPIIKIKSERGRTDVHNPTGKNWGEELVLDPPVYDADKERISFQMPKPALCLLRIGKVKGGPCYGTLLNWVPKPAGKIEVPWNGKDAQDVVNVGQREELSFRLITIALPESSILVLSSFQDRYPSEAKYKRFPLHPPNGQNVFIHAHHQRWICKDFTISAEIKNAARKWWGRRVVKGDTDISVALSNNGHYDYLKKEQFEIYLYVDDQFIREEKRESVPSSITLDTTKLSKGKHIVTVGLRTLEDHMGTYTMKINVDN